MSSQKYKIVIIIGAPRSGTNMLRDLLCSFNNLNTWPCDEINYIWRHGNLSHGSDELLSYMARPAVKRYIRKQFDWVAQKYSASYVIEKTCANSLRVPFINSVLPDAKYIFIVRDGIDVVSSAGERWSAQINIPYLLKKARFVPLIDLPYHCVGYFWNIIYKLFSKKQRLAIWGPKTNDMESLLAKHSLDEVCAIQWQRCVEHSTASFQEMENSKFLKLNYESFVSQPMQELNKVLSFLELDFDVKEKRNALAVIKSDSIGKGRAKLNGTKLKRIERLIYRTLSQNGYK